MSGGNLDLEGGNGDGASVMEPTPAANPHFDPATDRPHQTVYAAALAQAKRNLAREVRRRAVQVLLWLVLPAVGFSLWFWSPSQVDKRWQKAVIHREIVVPVRRATGKDISGESWVKHPFPEHAWKIANDEGFRQTVLENALRRARKGEE